MTAVAALDQLQSRRCPVCGSSAEEAVIEANVEASRLGPLAFASRKPPELMHHRLVGCPVCDTLYASPAPTPAALEAAYAAAAYDSAESARFAARTYAGFLPRVLARTPAGGGGLDIGAGDGAFLRELMASGVHPAIGVEPSPAAVATAAPDIRVHIRQAVFRPEHFDVGGFRLVTALQTLEHVADPLAVCRGARDLLRDGGALLVVCHNRRAPANRAMGRRSPIFDVQHLQLFSPRSLRALLDRAGLADVELLPVPNRYPLRAWLRLAPVPAPLKRRLLRVLRGRVGGVPLRLPAGNLAAIGYRRAR
jgi:SAM-dependent methyltransferase